MEAVIMAGGEGRRLRPYTHIIPKPLVPVGDKAILEIIMDQLVKRGFTKIYLAVGHKSDYIKAFIDNKEKYKGKVFLSYEKIPLGTAGPIKLLEGQLKGDFLVINGDTLSDIDYRDLLNKHKLSKKIATIAIFQKETKIDLGIVRTDDKKDIARYIEKPTFKNFVSTGIYAFSPEVFTHIKENEAIGFPDLVKRMMGNGHKVGTYHLKGTWMDLGRFEEFDKANKFYENNKSKFE